MREILRLDDKNYDESWNTIHREVAKAIFYVDGKLVMQRSSQGDVKCIGGGIEDGEDPIDCLKREVLEESGYRIKEGSIKEIGIVYEKRKDFFATNIWEMVTYLYECEVETKEREPIVLTETEKKQGMECVFIDPEQAIIGNEKSLEYGVTSPWLKRELKILKFLFRKKNLILFVDSGDTFVDETSEKRDDSGIVQDAKLIEGGEEAIRFLHNEGYTICLVADGERESFENIYAKYKLRDCFDGFIVSEDIGVKKPDPKMFEKAMEELGLDDKDKERIVMIGNNLKKDIAGANKFGIRSVWVNWSDRYFNNIEEDDWEPDFTVKTADEILSLIKNLENFLSFYK